MKFTCNMKTLEEALSVVIKALSTRTTNPVLETVKLQTVLNGVELTCSDERMTIVTRIPAAVSEVGGGLVPGKLFNDIIHRLPDDTIEIGSNANNVFKITCGLINFNVPGQAVELFPALPVVKHDHDFTLPQDMLKRLIEKTQFAIAAEDMREVLTGACLVLEKGKATMVALDGYRLAMCAFPCADSDDKVTAIIPGRALADIAKLLIEADDAFAEITVGGGKLYISMNDVDVYINLIAGQFINYDAIIPKQYAVRARVNLESFKRAVERAELMARQGSNNLLILKLNDNIMTVEAHGPLGDAHDELLITHEGTDLVIAFNVRYMMDVVRNIDSDEIELSMNTPVTPCIVRPVDDRDYTHLVLPVRTGATA